MKKFLLKNFLVLIALTLGFTGAYAQDDAATDELPVAQNIAELKAMENGTEVKLMLNDTKVTLQVMSMRGGSQTIIEDATGGIQVIGADGWIVEYSVLDEIFTEVGQTFNGYIYCRYVNEFGQIGIQAIEDKTTKDTYEVTMTEVTPTVMTMAEACSESGQMRYVRLNDVTMECDLEGSSSGDRMLPFILHQGESEAYFYDMMNTFLSYDVKKNQYVFPKNMENLDGYVIDMGGEYGFVPMALLPVVENIAELKSGLVKEGMEAKLMLNDTKVSIVVPSMMGSNQVYIEDETGGVMVNVGNMRGQTLFGEIFTTPGQTFNGHIYCNYVKDYGVSYIEPSESTTTDTYTVTQTEVIPSEIDIKQACDEEWTMRLVKMSKLAVSFNSADYELFLHQGTSLTMPLYEMLGVVFDPDEETYPEYVDDITGYVMVVEEADEDAGTPAIYAFVPLEVTPMDITPISATNIAALKELVDNSTATDEVTEYALTLDGTYVTLWGPAAWEQYSYIEDASGAIKVDGNISNNILDGDGVALTGKLIGTVSKDEDGIYTFELSENSGLSYFDSEEVETIPSTLTTIGDINNKTAELYAKYLRLENVTVKSELDEYDDYVYTISDGENEIVFYDGLWAFDPDLLPEIGKFNSVTGFVGTDWEGTLAFIPYGELDDYEMKLPEEVANIAGLKALESGTSVKLTLTDAKVTVREITEYGWMSTTEIYIEDASGAMKLGDDLVIGFEDMDLDYFAAVGNTLNGVLYCSYTNAYGEIGLSSSGRSFTESEIVKTEGTVVPTAVAIADIDTKANNFRLVKISGAKMIIDEVEGPTLVQGENSITVNDRYNKIQDLIGKLTGEDVASQSDDAADDAETEPNVPESLYIESAIGILIDQVIDFDDDNNPITISLFVPVGENPFVEGVDPSTGITSINSSVLNNGDVYSANGVKVRKAGESLDGLAKGLYIVNGKKVVIK